MKFRSNPVKEGSEIGNIGCDGSIGKFTERKDIGMFLNVIVIIHGISPPVRKNVKKIKFLQERHELP